MKKAKFDFTNLDISMRQEWLLYVRKKYLEGLDFLWKTGGVRNDEKR